jgi:hypothetical protein
MAARRKPLRPTHPTYLTCTSCRGEGITVEWVGSSYDPGMGGYYPREEYATCRDCQGTGEALCHECNDVAVYEDLSTEHVFYCGSCCPEAVRLLHRFIHDPSIDLIAQSTEGAEWRP